MCYQIPWPSRSSYLTDNRQIGILRDTPAYQTSDSWTVAGPKKLNPRLGTKMPRKQNQILCSFLATRQLANCNKPNTN